MDPRYWRFDRNIAARYNDDTRSAIVKVDGADSYQTLMLRPLRDADESDESRHDASRDSPKRCFRSHGGGRWQVRKSVLRSIDLSDDTL